MALVKKEAVDKIEIVNADDIPMIQVRKAVWVEDDETGEVFGGKQYSRHVCTPDDDPAQESLHVFEIAKVMHTQAVKDKWAAKKAAEAPQLPDQAEKPKGA